MISEAAFLIWDARLGEVVRAYEHPAWEPVDWAFAESRREGTRFAGWR